MTILLRFKILVVYVCSILNSKAQDSTFKKNYTIGGTAISIETTCFGNCLSPVVFVNVHDDENTAVEATEIFLADTGGWMVQLKHKSKRLISFIVNKRKYTFDPNRIFTDEGLQLNLKLHSTYNSAAAKRVIMFRNELERTWQDEKKLIVAVHNNKDGQYSILTYTHDPTEKRNAAEVYINENMDPDDFIYTTERQVFERIKKMDINVVLQNNETVADDGSLSVYAARKKLAFINVEAQHGHLDEQLTMLQAIAPLVKEYEETGQLLTPAGDTGTKEQ